MITPFAYRQAIESGCFLQVPLFGPHELRRAAAARGLLDFPQSVSWEPLDRDGLFPPVAYARQPLPAALHLQALSEGSLLIRDECGYAEWRDDEYAEQGVIPLYAHWQLLSLAELHESLTGRSPLAMLAGGVAQLGEELSRRARTVADPGYVGRLVEGQRDLELLLTRTQSLFMPLVRRSHIVDAVFARNGELLDLDTHQWVVHERAQLDYARAAEGNGVTAEDIARRYDALMTKAERLDPLREWRDLVDRADRRKIDALSGEARRAQDLYDAAEVLRLWHRRLADGDLYEERDASIHSGPGRRKVNKQLYGSEELRGNRAGSGFYVEIGAGGLAVAAGVIGLAARRGKANAPARDQEVGRTAPGDEHAG